MEGTIFILLYHFYPLQEYSDIYLRLWGQESLILNTMRMKFAKCKNKNYFPKETLAQVFSYEFCEISKKHLFYRTPLGGCFWKYYTIRLNPLRANHTKWSNTLKQFVGKLPTNCLSVFDHLLTLALQGLIKMSDFSPSY